MSLVKGKDTGPELKVRRWLHAQGYRYRLHAANLPGKPDLVFPARRKVILVHGCFWHRHARCSLARLPKSRPEFWIPKLEANAERDKKNVKALRKLGWEVLVVWECETTDMDGLGARMIRFLKGSKR